jgi:hypothetical protein
MGRLTLAILTCDFNYVNQFVEYERRIASAKHGVLPLRYSSDDLDEERRSTNCLQA